MSMISSTYLKQIDDLYDSGRHQEIYDKLRRPDGNYSAVPAEILWRFARAIRYLSKNFHFPSYLPVFTKGRGNKNARKAWLAEALGIMKMAVEKYPGDCYCNTWYAIILHLESQEESKKKRIELTYVIREYLDKAYQINSKYGILLHCLGGWCFEIARYNKFEREIASLFFTNLPETSFDEALRYYLESYQVNPNLGFTAARIAQCYDRIKNREAAKKWAEKALTYPERDDEVVEAQEECRRILKNNH